MSTELTADDEKAIGAAYSKIGDPYAHIEAGYRAALAAREDTERPALDVLTGHLDLGHLIDLDGTPSECEDGLYRCPFCKGETQSPHDPGESDFYCMLLDRTVWGETAPCTRMDWQERARRELGVRDTEQPNDDLDNYERSRRAATGKIERTAKERREVQGRHREDTERPDEED